MDEKTYPERGILEKGVNSRMHAPGTPKHEHDPETLAITRRAREKWLREYLERLDRRLPAKDA